MSIANTAAVINEHTGWTGAQLETATHAMAMLFADAMGDHAIGDYFQRRMRDSFAKGERVAAYEAQKEARRQALIKQYGGAA